MSAMPQGAELPSAIDIGFCQDMAAHHQQAVLMAGLAGGRAGPAVAALADSILGPQSQELGAMRGWLRLWGQPAESSTPMAWMSGDKASDAGMSHLAPMSMHPDALMPGMASPEELTDLWAKTGHDFDVLFLQLMIRHHQGGVAMAQYAAAHGTLDAVRQSAGEMVFQQGTEIGEMNALLKTYGAAPLPPS